MSDTLAKIAAYKRQEIAAAKAVLPLDELSRIARDAAPIRGFLAALEAKRDAGKAGLIAEIKKASPSKGIIREDFNPPLLAKAYEDGGAACLSVLTDTPSFQGALAFLSQARESTSLPCLRKDFMFEPYQVVEARAWNADCILIIMASTTDDEAKALYEAAGEWGMDALIEVHNREQLDRALLLKPKLLGVNNRDLRDFSVSLETTITLAKDLPSDILLVSESGISTAEDIAYLSQHGVSAYLVGTSLMRQNDLTAASQKLLA